MFGSCGKVVSSLSLFFKSQEPNCFFRVPRPADTSNKKSNIQSHYSDFRVTFPSLIKMKGRKKSSSGGGACHMVSFRANLMIFRLKKQKQFWIFDADSGKKTRLKDYLDPHTSGDRLHIWNDKSKQVQDEKKNSGFRVTIYQKNGHKKIFSHGQFSCKFNNRTTKKNQCRIFDADFVWEYLDPDTSGDRLR